jgi:hypothetical protein
MRRPLQIGGVDILVGPWSFCLLNHPIEVVGAVAD